jgi:hypothetical protein
VGAFYMLLSFCWRLPDPWWLISWGTVIRLVSVQRACQRVNDVAQNPEGQNSNYGTANVVTIVLGGLLFVLSVIGTFMPQ